MRVRPAARDEFSMPAKERRRRYEERPLPCMPRQHTTERREQRPIRRREPRPSDLTLQHAKLVAQQQDLDLLLSRSERRRSTTSSSSRRSDQ